MSDEQVNTKTPGGKNLTRDTNSDMLKPVDMTAHTAESRSSLDFVGHVSDTKRADFGIFSLLGMGFSICNTAMTCMGSLAASLGGGGPVVFVWGLVLNGFMAMSVACSLAELSSAMPHSGGQYYWTSQLAPSHLRRGLSYLVGFLSWGGAVVTAAGATLALPQFVFGMVVLNYPDFEAKPWMMFVGFQIANASIFCLNLFERILPALNIGSMSFSIGSMVVIFVTLLATTQPKADASSVFAELQNFSGWSDGVAFMISLVGPNWGFASMDAVTHMADEVLDPSRNIPKALGATVLVGLATGLPFMIGICFCINDIDSVVNTPTGVPSLQLFFNSTRSLTGACALQSLMFVVFVGSVISVHTWQARMAWAFARDNGWPYSKSLATIAPKPMRVPLLAHAWSCAWVAVLGCLYLGSNLAFSSLVSGGILLQYLSYSICIILLWCRGRQKIVPGPFWLPIIGRLANALTLVWTACTLVFYCFPATFPTAAEHMNYVSVVLVFMCLYAFLFWILNGRHNYICPPLVESNASALM